MKTLGVHSVQKQIQNANLFGKCKQLMVPQLFGKRIWCIDNGATINARAGRNDKNEKNGNAQNN